MAEENIISNHKERKKELNRKFQDWRKVIDLIKVSRGGEVNKDKSIEAYIQQLLTCLRCSEEEKTKLKMK